MPKTKAKPRHEWALISNTGDTKGEVIEEWSEGQLRPMSYPTRWFARYFRNNHQAREEITICKVFVIDAVDYETRRTNEKEA